MTELRALPYDWKDLRKRLQARILDLLPALSIVDAPRNGLVMPRNPTRTDRHAGSFVIWCGRDAAGAWKDYATGESGDVFDLVGYLLGLREKIDAYWWALEFLGLGRGVVRSAEDAVAARQRAERERLAGEARAGAEATAKSAALFKQWLTLAPIAGTIAETYLREARRIPLDRLGSMPGALRLASALDHIDRDSGEVTSWPCMVAAMTRGTKVVALHRTWLAPDGSGKAPVDKPKKMIGPTAGAAIRLSAGVGGLSPSKAAEKGKLGPLGLGEGIETCLTVACARLDYRVWAAGSLSLMGLVEWPACASAAVLLGENDYSPQAVEAFARVEARWRAMSQGRPLVTVASQVGSDFNDWACA